MTKAEIKKKLSSMSKEKIILLMMDLYSARKEAAEFIDLSLEPALQGVYSDKYKAVIHKEFNPKNQFKVPKLTVCKKAISDFSKLNPSPEMAADLILFYVENGCQYADDCGDLWEAFYNSMESSFEKALKLMHKNKILPQFRIRALKCCKLADGSGYGFPDAMNDIYKEYY